MPLTVIFITIIVTATTPMGYTAVNDPFVCLPQGRPRFHSSLCPKASIESVAYGAQTVSYPIPEFSIQAPSRYLCCWWTDDLGNYWTPVGLAKESTKRTRALADQQVTALQVCVAGAQPARHYGQVCAVHLSEHTAFRCAHCLRVCWPWCPVATVPSGGCSSYYLHSSPPGWISSGRSF